MSQPVIEGGRPATGWPAALYGVRIVNIRDCWTWVLRCKLQVKHAQRKRVLLENKIDQTPEEPLEFP